MLQIVMENIGHRRRQPRGLLSQQARVVPGRPWVQMFQHRSHKRSQAKATIFAFSSCLGTHPADAKRHLAANKRPSLDACQRLSAESFATLGVRGFDRGTREGDRQWTTTEATSQTCSQKLAETGINIGCTRTAVHSTKKRATNDDCLIIQRHMSHVGVVLVLEPIYASMTITMGRQGEHRARSINLSPTQYVKFTIVPVTLGNTWVVMVEQMPALGRDEQTSEVGRYCLGMAFGS